MRTRARRPGTTDPWGLVPRFKDAQGVWRQSSETTRAAVLAAMGAEPGASPPGAPRVRVVRRGQRLRLDGPADLVLEDGAVVRAGERLPRDLPLGYHELRPVDGGPAVRLIASPGRCHLPRGLRAWGWAVQLYAARSRESWGIGDLADLGRLGRWSRRDLGAGLLLVNPLGAATPVTPLQPSPYCPTSRRFRHPIYLRIEEVPGADSARLDLEKLAAQGRALDAERRIDRDAVYRLKLSALERLWSRFEGDGAFDRYRAEQGEALAGFATFCALAERHGRDWRGWPGEVRRPDALGVARFRLERAERVRFHQWLQWLVDGQLARASAEIPMMHDLPVGVDPGGADAWAWQDVLSTGATVGAPPDLYNTRGQDWGLPPFVPHRLAEVGYRPFVETIRANLRHAGGLRIDHVMGLFRLYWIPKGMSPTEGAYVRYPADDLLAIVALESHRAGAGGGRRGPRHRGGRRARAPARPSRAVVPAGVVRGATAGALPQARHGRRHHPRPAHRRGPLDRRRSRGPEGARPPAQRGGAARHPGARAAHDAVAGRCPRRAGRRADLPVAGRSAFDARHRDTRGRLRHARPPQHARHRHRVAQLVPGPAGAARGGRAPAAGARHRGGTEGEAPAYGLPLVGACVMRSE